MLNGDVKYVVANESFDSFYNCNGRKDSRDDKTRHDAKVKKNVTSEASEKLRKKESGENLLVVYLETDFISFFSFFFILSPSLSA